MPNAGDELHHFGWNACSSCLCPNAPHPHAERRYLIVPGLRSSRIHILDTKPNPRQAEDRPGPGATGSRRTVRLHPPAHDPLRTGGHLRRRPRQRARRGARRRVPDGPRDLRHPRPLGNRPRTAAPRLRCMVAPRLRHHGDERVGPARDFREWPGPGGPAGRPIRPQAALLGPARAQAQAGDRLRRRKTSWSSNFVPRTTRPRPMVSSIRSSA